VELTPEEQEALDRLLEAISGSIVREMEPHEDGECYIYGWVPCSNCERRQSTA
jgi:hypothetical protein